MPVQSDSQTSEWYSYFENDVLVLILGGFEWKVNTKVQYSYLRNDVLVMIKGAAATISLQQLLYGGGFES